MLILGIDTATPVAAVALADETTVLYEAHVNSGFNHSRTLLKMVDSGLRQLGREVGELDAVAVSIGPGSFTGLRIGLATAKGLALAVDAGIIGVPTLDALAAAYNWMDMLICPIMNARKGEVYTAFYRGGAGYSCRLSEYIALRPEELAAESKRFMASERCSSVLFTGDGVPVFRNQLEQALGDSFKAPPDELALPRAACLVRLGVERLAAGELDDVLDLKPIYVRLSEAEHRLLQK